MQLLMQWKPHNRKVGLLRRSKQPYSIINSKRCVLLQWVPNRFKKQHQSLAGYSISGCQTLDDYSVAGYSISGCQNPLFLTKVQSISNQPQQAFSDLEWFPTNPSKCESSNLPPTNVPPSTSNSWICGTSWLFVL